MHILKKIITKLDAHLLTALFLLITVLFLKLSSFVTEDKIPPHWDYASHLSNTLDYMTAVKNLDIQEVFTIFGFYPPFVYILMAAFFILFGYSEIVTVIFNFFLFFVLLAGTYWFSLKISDKLTAAGATLFVFALVLTPGQLNVKLWELMLDFPQAVIIVLTYCLYYYSIKQGRFTLKRAFLLGGITTVALLTKWTTAIYVIVPYLFYCMVALKHHRFGAIVLLTSTIVTAGGSWYIVHWYDLYPQLVFFATEEGVLNADPQGLWGLVYYFDRIRDALGWPVFVYIFLRTFFSLIKIIGTKQIPKVGLLHVFDVAMILFPYIVFSFLLLNKNERYLYPVFILFPFIVFVHTKITQRLLNSIFALALLGIALYRVFFYWPQPNIEKNARKALVEIFSVYRPQRVAYFFEDDTSLFNHSNVALLHKELSDIYGQPVFYYYLNNHGIENQRSQCVFSDSPDLVIVYSGSDPIRDAFSRHIPYSENCVQHPNCYQLVKTYDFTYERLLVYRRSNSCSAQIP